MAKTIRVPKVRPRKVKTTKPASPPADQSRTRLFTLLAEMPDEAFGWVLIALATRIWPDGLGGFMPDSRTSIEAVKSEAGRLAGFEPTDTKERP